MTNYTIRPFIIALCLFISLNGALLLLVNYTPVGKTLNYYSGNTLIVKLPLLKNISKKETIDVLAIGSSITDSNFAPPYFDQYFNNKINTFNLGLHAARPDIFRLCLEHYLKNHTKPKLVIVEIADNHLLKDNRYLPALYYIGLLKLNLSNILSINQYPDLDFEDKKEIILSLASPIYAFRGVLSPLKFFEKSVKRLQLVLNQENKTTSEELVEFDNLKGWVPYPYTHFEKDSASLASEIITMQHQTLNSLTSVDLSSFEAFLKYCQNTGIKVAIVQWPTLPQYQQLFEQSSVFPKYQSTIHKYAKQYDAELIVLDNLTNVDHSKFFKDGRHLSHVGAKYFTLQIAEHLKNAGLIND